MLQGPLFQSVHSWMGSAGGQPREVTAPFPVTAADSWWPWEPEGCQ